MSQSESRTTEEINSEKAKNVLERFMTFTGKSVNSHFNHPAI